MRILWMADSPEIPTGVGHVTRYVCAGLARLGHEVSILGGDLSPVPPDARPRTWGLCTYYPFLSARSVQDRMQRLIDVARATRADVLVSMGPIAWYARNARAVRHVRAALDLVWVMYVPIEGDRDDGRLPARWVSVLRGADLVVVMSAYGQRVVAAHGLACATIPHGVDLRLFAPPAHKADAKRALGWADRFVVLSDARNQLHKMLPRAVEIFRRFAVGKPDVLLHLHCDADDRAMRTAAYQYDVRADLALLGLEHRARVTSGMSMVRGGLTLEAVAALYQGADVHLLTSMGEGFGLPTLQAAASGVVPLAGAYTTSAELVAGHGAALAIRRYLRDGLGIRHGLVDVADAVRALNALYHDRARLRSLAERARRFAERFAWDRIVGQWHALLAREVPARRSRRSLSADATAAADGEDVSAEAVTAGPLTIPVTLPSVEGGTIARVPGRVHVTGSRDLDVVRRLAELFPNVTAWSTHHLGDHVVRLAPGSADDRHWLGTSTLALDLGGLASDLPRRAAEAGVPCIARTSAVAERLWPALVLAAPDVDTAARLGRWMLSDYADAADLCDHARAQLELTGCR